MKLTDSKKIQKCLDMIMKQVSKIESVKAKYSETTVAKVLRKKKAKK